MPSNQYKGRVALYISWVDPDLEDMIEVLSLERNLQKNYSFKATTVKRTMFPRSRRRVVILFLPVDGLAGSIDVVEIKHAKTL